MISSSSSLSASNDNLDKYIDLSRTIIQGTTTNAVSLNVSVDYVVGFNTVINNMVSASTSASASTSINSDQIQTNVQKIYETFTDSILKLSAVDVKSGQRNISVSSNNLQIVVAPLTAFSTISSMNDNGKGHAFQLVSSNFNSTGRRLIDISIKTPFMLSVTRASLYSNLWKKRTNATMAEREQYTINSNPLRASLDCSAVSDMKVLVILQNYENQDYSPIHAINATFTTHCKNDVIDTHRYSCHYPDDYTYEISVNCMGTNDTFVTACPNRSRAPSCQLSTLSSESCTLVDYDDDSISCMCSMCSSSSHRQLADSGRTITFQVFTLTKYLFEDYASVMMTSSSLQAKDFLGTLIISLSFAVIWILIILLVTGQAIYKRNKNKVKSNSISILPDQPMTEISSMEQVLKEYITSYLPSIYKEEKRYEKIAKQILINHQYFSLLANEKNSLDHTSKWIDAFQLLTIVSANMFILAMLFDLRYPSDDQSCETFKSENVCLKRRTTFDTYCEWNSQSLSPCSFKTPSFDVMAVVLLAWLQLITTVPIKTLINFLFERIIYAATKTTIEDQIKSHQISFRRRVEEQVKRRMSQVAGGARRMSNALNTANVSDAINEVKRLSMAVKTTITVHSDFVQMRRSFVDTIHQQHRNTVRNDKKSNDLVIVLGSNAIDDVDEICDNFTKSFTEYRDSLSKVQRVKFDKYWSYLINFTDSTITAGGASSILSNSLVRVKPEEISEVRNRHLLRFNMIFSEISAVLEESKKALNKLDNSPPHVAGAEIMKIFLIDLLGRDTNAAIIFERTIEKDLRTVAVVSKYLKVVVIVLMVLLNFYFVYGSILYGRNKDSRWQYKWIAAFSLNLLIDIAYNGILEVIMISYVIPISILDETNVIKKKLDQLIQDIASKKDSIIDSNNASFSVTDFLFVSNNVGKSIFSLIITLSLSLLKSQKTT